MPTSPALVFRSFRSEKTCKKGNEGDTDKCNTAACHELLHALGLRAGVIIAVTFHEVDSTPNAKTCTKCYNECLKYAYCAVEKCHDFNRIPNPSNAVFCRFSAFLSKPKISFVANLSGQKCRFEVGFASFLLVKKLIFSNKKESCQAFGMIKYAHEYL